MTAHEEFHYRLPHRVGGYRPGAHPGATVGAGQEFVAHRRLYDAPDPRRLDIRASLRSFTGDWLVRAYRQRAGIEVQVVADVSASMAFGSPRSKLIMAANFVEALGASVFRMGDALGMHAFDAVEREDLFVPARVGRGVGALMASNLRSCSAVARSGGIDGLRDSVARLSSRKGLIFIVSDFHWSIEHLGAVLDELAPAFVVPMVVWHPAEIEPPAGDRLAPVVDAESGALRTLWFRDTIRERWREGVERRRAELGQLFLQRALRPFYVHGDFDSASMSRYFLEAGP
ncbi:MAG: MxaS protein [Pseudomonadota bacterium]|nr:MxaS protein [Pseudomonadota bacterium]